MNVKMSHDPIQPVASDENWTPVRIEAPLPLGVASVLMTVIGRLWPEAMMQTNDTSGRWALSVRLPPNAVAQDLTEEDLALATQQRDQMGDEDFEFMGFKNNELAFVPPETLMLTLGQWAHNIMTAHEPAAFNHVEWDVRTGNDVDSQQYILSISKSAEQTPLAMHKAAEAKLGKAEDRIAALERQLQRAGIEPEES